MLVIAPFFRITVERHGGSWSLGSIRTAGLSSGCFLAFTLRLEKTAFHVHDVDEKRK